MHGNGVVLYTDFSKFLNTGTRNTSVCEVSIRGVRGSVSFCISKGSWGNSQGFNPNTELSDGTMCCLVGNFTAKQAEAVLLHLRGKSFRNRFFKSLCATQRLGEMLFQIP